MPKLRAALIGFGLGLALTAFTAYAVLAADKGGPARHDDIVAPTGPGWTGPYISAGVGWNVGLANFGGPVGAGADGGSATATIGYDRQWGNVVGGVFMGSSLFFGDLESIGVKNDIFAGARLGVLMSSSNLLYGHAGYGRLDTDAGGVNSWRLGIGDEIKLSNSPFSLDFRYSFSILEDKLAPGVDLRGHTFGTALVWRF